MRRGLATALRAAAWGALRNGGPSAAVAGGAAGAAAAAAVAESAAGQRVARCATEAAAAWRPLPAAAEALGAARPRGRPRLAFASVFVAPHLRRAAAVARARTLTASTRACAMGRRSAREREVASANGGTTSTACYLQIIGCGGDSDADAPPSVMLFFDGDRYVFNVGEGFQRLCVEHKVRVGRVGNYLMTRTSTETLGGLPGLLLTLADLHGRGSEAGGVAGGVTLTGPPPLRAAVGSMAPYVHGRARGAATVHETASPADASGAGVRANEVVRTREVTITAFTVTPEGTLTDAQRARAAAAAAVGAAGANEQQQQRRLQGDQDSSSPAPEQAQRPAKRPRLQPGAMIGGEAACSYAIELPTAPGKFDMRRAEALGVPRDSRRGALVRGQTITLDDGTQIAPEQVLEASEPGPKALIIDCPTLGHLEQLRACEAFRALARTSSCAVHLSPAAVIESDAYRLWVAQGFGEGGAATHVLCAARAAPVPPAYGFSAAMATRLAAAVPEFFVETHSVENGVAARRASAGEPTVVAQGSTMLKFTLRPAASRGLDSSGVPAMPDRDALRAEAFKELAMAGTSGAKDEVGPADKVAANGASGAADGAMVGSERVGAKVGGAEVLFLGTGSAMPSKYRNVSALLVRPREDGAGGLLLDCGEGTVVQLTRALGRDGMLDVLANMAMVWISHVHADHHAGLQRLLTERRRELQRRLGLGPDERVPPLAVVAPPLVRRYLEWYGALEKLSATIIPIEGTTSDAMAGADARSDESGDWPPVELTDAMRRAGVGELSSVLVDHCQHAYGIVLRSAGAVTRGADGGEGAAADGDAVSGGDANAWSLAYSGDTRPTPKLVRAARAVDLLIHEATFEDGLLSEAMAKRHSTTTEALQTGRDAGVGALLLTHFSQRYPKVPNFRDVGSDPNGMAVGVAFDLMRVVCGGRADAPGSARRLTSSLPKLEALFQAEMDGMADEGDDGDATFGAEAIAGNGGGGGGGGAAAA